MLNKKAIAAFAAGATLLSGLAFAAPAFATVPAAFKKEFTQEKSDKAIADAQKAVDDAQKTVNEKKATFDEKYAAANATVKPVFTANGEIDTAKYTLDANGSKITKKGESDAVAGAYAFYEANVKPLEDARHTLGEKQATLTAAQNADYNTVEKFQDRALKALKKAKGDVDDALKTVNDAFTKLVEAAKNTKAAKKAHAKDAAALKAFEDAADDDQADTNAYKLKHNPLVKAEAKSARALRDAESAQSELQKAFNKAEREYGTKVSKTYTGKLLAYFNAYQDAKDVEADLKGYSEADDLVLDDADYDLKLAVSESGDAGQGGKGDKGQGGQGEGGQGESGKGDKGHGDKPGALPNAAQASANLMHAQVVLQDASANRTKAVKDSNDAKAALDKAQAQYDALFAQFKAASDNYQNNFVLTGKADTDAGKAAKADVDAAKALVDAYGSNELANAKKDYAEKSGKALVASQAFNAAKEQYRLAYNVALRVEASAVKGFQDPKTIADAPLDFPAATAAAKAEAGKLAAAAAQAGKAADAAAAGAHGANAAAGENGGKKKNNAGEDAKKKLGQTGATVALAAVAASVLAGVGAALRKIRH